MRHAASKISVSQLVITLAILKLCGQISWSWWWVFSPVFAAIGIAVIVLVMAFTVERWERDRRRKYRGLGLDESDSPLVRAYDRYMKNKKL